MGKVSKRRPGEGYGKNYDNIFGKNQRRLNGTERRGDKDPAKADERTGAPDREIDRGSTKTNHLQSD